VSDELEPVAETLDSLREQGEAIDKILDTVQKIQNCYDEREDEWESEKEELDDRLANYKDLHALLVTLIDYADRNVTIDSAPVHIVQVVDDVKRLVRELGD
jgi:hypothetical protein